MLKIILSEPKLIHPFNESARELRIQNKPLWLLQRDVLAPYVDRELELPPEKPLPITQEECLVYKDNLYFNKYYIEKFFEEARRRGRPCRAAFSEDDPAFREHALPLATSYQESQKAYISGTFYLADLWYYPNGPTADTEPLIIDLQTNEAGYYHVPTYMAAEQGDLTFQVPLLSLMAIDSWVHIFIADIVFGQFGRVQRYSQRLKTDLFFKLDVLKNALFEGKQVLSCSSLVKMGKNCTVHPGAMIFGPTIIGDNVTIDAGAVIENCFIGDNVNIGQGCQVMLSVVGDGAFLPFRSSLFMTTFMDNSMVAQNTCLQMCVIGRNTFLGAGSTFTDFNLIPTPLKAIDGHGVLRDANRPVLGGCVGHNCRIGAGMIIFPARTIESDVVLVASPERRIIQKSISYEESDHTKFSFANLHKSLYRPYRQDENESW
jgi:carbonic anhydrase/acetyltransferase-like protein (isoleucine patch superfamily)